MRPVVTDRVAWSVGLSVTVVSPAILAETDRDAFWVVGSGGQKTMSHMGSRYPQGKYNFWGVWPIEELCKA